MKGETPDAATVREALEEAGLIGEIGKRPIGSYRYVKRLGSGAPLLCDVDVFALHVTRQRKHWREMAQRANRWLFPIEKAAEAVQEPELQALIKQFGRIVTRAALLREAGGAPRLN